MHSRSCSRSPRSSRARARSSSLPRQYRKARHDRDSRKQESSKRARSPPARSQTHLHSDVGRRHRHRHEIRHEKTLDYQKKRTYVIKDHKDHHSDDRHRHKSHSDERYHRHSRRSHSRGQSDPPRQVKSMAFRVTKQVESYANGYHRAKQSKTSGGQSPSRCIGIFGMNGDTTQTDLFVLFKEFGYIDYVRLCRDRDTGRSRGFAFIYYNTIDGAERAKRRLDDTLIGGSRVRIDFAAVLKDNRFVG